MSPIFLPHPIKPPTGEERSVIFWMIFLVLLGCGAVCLYYGYRAPAEKAKEAGELAARGYCFLVASIAMLVYRRFFSRLFLILPIGRDKSHQSSIITNNMA